MTPPLPGQQNQSSMTLSDKKFPDIQPEPPQAQLRAANSHPERFSSESSTPLPQHPKPALAPFGSTLHLLSLPTRHHSRCPTPGPQLPSPRPAPRLPSAISPPPSGISSGRGFASASRACARRQLSMRRAPLFCLASRHFGSSREKCEPTVMAAEEPEVDVEGDLAAAPGEAASE